MREHLIPDFIGILCLNLNNANGIVLLLLLHDALMLKYV